MISIGVGVNVSRWGRLRRFVEKRWGERNPERANRLKPLLRNRYGDPAPGERNRRRTYSEIVAQEAGRKRRAEDRRVKERHQFLRYLDLQEVHDDQAEIDLGSLARIAVGVKGANRHEQLFFADLDRPEAPIVLAYERPPWDPEDGPERTPGAIQLTLADAYWWCTSGLIAWFDGKWHPLTDEQGQDIRDAEGRPSFLTAYPGPDPGRIESWRQGRPISAPAKPRWDREDRKLWFGKTLCREYTKKAPNQFAIVDSFEESGWLRTIPDPTPREQLKQTIDDLNEGLTSDCPIRFGFDNKRATWGPRKADS